MSIPNIRRFKSFEDSRFWTRLNSGFAQNEMYDDEESQSRIRHLISSVDQVARNSKTVLDQIVRYLPQYTLHNERHILNALSLMDWLTPADTLNHLAPLECALIILAAYTHDLGMALTCEEYHRLTTPEGSSSEREAFVRFRDRYSDEIRRIERWKQSAPEVADLHEWHILSTFVKEKERPILEDYIRVTHTCPTVIRVNHWLEAFKEGKEGTKNEGLFTYGPYDYQPDLVLIGLSHGMPVRWLRDQFAPPGRAREDAFMLSLERGEQINRAFPGLLLRLADYMDFDATRAPRILFRHAGIIDKVSIQEWTKHQAISGWSPEGSGSNFRFAFKSHQCPDPVTHKTILDFVAKIDAEIHAVREEAHWQSRPLPDAQRDHYRLDLPHKVEADVNPKGHPHHSIYIYHDLQFRLDQDEIQKLLMGTALYGDPGLCIRELLQNALDALELRKLRLKMLEETDETPREKVDRLRRGEELQVTLTWGRDPKTEQEFIRVTDNGVGMTRKVIQDYFTQVGKSYYRSADYRQEQAALANAGYTTSPISLFGIGILSCFMIAERLEVRTRPGEADDGERQPFDVTISGPGSLFWLKPGTLKHQGTEITLFLKRGFQLQHNAQTLLNRLTKHFGYPTQTDEDPKTPSEIEEETGSKDQSKTIPIDPAFLAAAHVVWPRYPVIVKTPGEREPEIRIDDRFHLDVLLPIDPAKVVAKAKEWDFPESCVGRPCWKYWEWRDERHDQATGSRVRLWFAAHCKNADPSGQGQAKDPTQDFPVDSPDGRLCRYHDLAAFVETQLENNLRARVLVQGMHVQESDLATERLEIAPAVGTRLWVDLRGGAAPGLTTDRRRMLIPENDEIKGPAHWEEEIHRLFERCFEVLTSSLQRSDLSTWHNMATGFRWTGTDPP